MATTPAESEADLRTVARGATRDYAVLQASTPQPGSAAAAVDLDAVAEATLRMLRSTAQRLLRPEEFEYLVDEAIAGLGDTGSIADFLQDPLRPAYTPREINAKQLVWVHLNVAPSAGEPPETATDFDWWGASVRTLRDVQDAFCKHVADELTVAEFGASDRDRQDQNEALAAFSRFLLAWLRVVCPFGEMDSLLLAVSDYGDS
jgi:hypothetical protein